MVPPFFPINRWGALNDLARVISHHVRRESSCSTHLPQGRCWHHGLDCAEVNPDGDASAVRNEAGGRTPARGLAATSSINPSN